MPQTPGAAQPNEAANTEDDEGIAGRTWRCLAPWIDLKAFRRGCASDAPTKENKTVSRTRDFDLAYQEVLGAAIRTESDYIPSSSFRGGVPGYMFSTRKGKVGYFRDKETLAQDDTRDSKCPPLPILLENLICPGIHQPTSTSGLRGKKPHAKAKKRKTEGPIPACEPSTTPDCHTWRDKGLWIIDTLNSSSWNSSARYKASSIADVLLLQETRILEHRDGEGATRAQANREAREGKWKAALSMALACTNGSSSGGTAVLAKNAQGLEHLVALAPDTNTHRVTYAHTTAANGIVVISLYLRFKEGLRACQTRTLLSLRTLAPASPP